MIPAILCLLIRCFKIASIPWYLRSAASMIFATPPSSTYEEVMYYLHSTIIKWMIFYTTYLPRPCPILMLLRKVSLGHLSCSCV